MTALLKPMTASEVAAELGVSVDTFYRRRADYHRDGMPAAITRHRPFRFHRASMQAWLGRHHPLAPKPAANDDTVERDALARCRSELAAEYGT